MRPLLRFLPGILIDSGIGAAITKAFAQSGCKRIAITDANKSLLADTAAWINKEYPDTEVLQIDGDISSPEFVADFYSAVNSKLGRIDYAVNVAGILGNDQPTTETSVEDFDKVNNVNYRGVWLCSREALKYMKAQEPLPSHDPSRSAQRGSIVSIASQLGIVARADSPVYCASKAAVIGLTKSDAIDYAKYDIRVNCVCPGVIATPMTSGADSSPEFAARLKSSIDTAPMRRMGKPEEIADAVLFLSSTKASFVTGHAMVVDGGYIIN